MTEEEIYAQAVAELELEAEQKQYNTETQFDLEAMGKVAPKPASERVLDTIEAITNLAGMGAKNISLGTSDDLGSAVSSLLGSKNPRIAYAVQNTPILSQLAALLPESAKGRSRVETQKIQDDSYNRFRADNLGTSLINDLYTGGVLGKAVAGANLVARPLKYGSNATGLPAALARMFSSGGNAALNAVPASAIYGAAETSPDATLKERALAGVESAKVAAPLAALFGATFQGGGDLLQKYFPSQRALDYKEFGSKGDAANPYAVAETIAPVDRTGTLPRAASHKGEQLVGVEDAMEKYGVVKGIKVDPKDPVGARKAYAEFLNRLKGLVGREGEDGEIPGAITRARDRLIRQADNSQNAKKIFARDLDLRELDRAIIQREASGTDKAGVEALKALKKNVVAAFGVEKSIRKSEILDSQGRPMLAEVFGKGKTTREALDALQGYHKQMAQLKVFDNPAKAVGQSESALAKIKASSEGLNKVAAAVRALIRKRVASTLGPAEAEELLQLNEDFSSLRPLLDQAKDLFRTNQMTTVEPDSSAIRVGGRVFGEGFLSTNKLFKGAKQNEHFDVLGRKIKELQRILDLRTGRTPPYTPIDVDTVAAATGPAVSPIAAQLAAALAATKDKAGEAVASLWD